MQPCEFEMAIAALVKAADEILTINSCLTSFFFLPLSEELSLRWADCSFWLQAAGAAWQTALLPSEWASSLACFSVLDLRCSVSFFPTTMINLC